MNKISRKLVFTWLYLLYIKTTWCSERLCHNSSYAVCPGAEQEMCRFSSSLSWKSLRVGITNKKYCANFQVQNESPSSSTKNCDGINITAVYDNGTRVIKSEIISGPKNKTIEVSCLEVHGLTPTDGDTCHINLVEDRPLPPINITVAKDYPAIVWDIPSYTGSSFNVLITYNVTVSSSTGSSTSFYVTSTNSTNFLSTNGFSMDDCTANYTICVTAANCIGVSEPNCTMKFQVLCPIATSPPPAAPVIKNASIVNKALKETVVSLELQLPDIDSNQSNRTTNYTQEYQVEMVDLKITDSLQLDSQNKILVNVPNSLKQTTFRVRTISQEGITGNWSAEVCLKFKIPEISLKPSVDINGTLRLELTKPDNIDSMPAGKGPRLGVANCSLPFISKVDIIVENRNGLRIFNKSNVFNKIDEVVEFNITNISNSLNELNKITTVLHTVLGDHKQEAYFFYKLQENCTNPPVYSKATNVQDSRIILILLTIIITFVLKL